MIQGSVPFTVLLPINILDNLNLCCFPMVTSSVYSGRVVLKPRLPSVFVSDLFFNALAPGPLRGFIPESPRTPVSYAPL